MRSIFGFVIMLCLASLVEKAGAQPATEPVSSTTTQPAHPPRGDERPILHDSLTPQQLDRVQQLHSSISEVIGLTLDQGIQDLRRDPDPDSTLTTLERAARAYTAYCTRHDLSPEAKKEAYKVSLMRAVVSQDEVLRFSEFKLISREDAIELMKNFDESAASQPATKNTK